jgi:hypothetical protein
VFSGTGNSGGFGLEVDFFHTFLCGIIGGLREDFLNLILVKFLAKHLV